MFGFKLLCYVKNSQSEILKNTEAKLHTRNEVTSLCSNTFNALEISAKYGTGNVLQ